MSATLDAIARHAARRPSAAALVMCDAEGCEHFAWTYRQLYHACARAALDLSHHPGIGTIRSVALIASPRPSTIAALLGAVASGLRVVAIHPSASPVEVSDAMRCVGTNVLLSPGAMKEAVAPDPAIDDRAALPADPSRAGEGSIVLSSSGTTGRPALAIRTASSLHADARNVREGLGLDITDRVVLGVPACHSYGVDIIWGVLEAGATLVWLPQMGSQSLTRVVAEAATVLPGVPFHYDMLAREESRSHSLRLAVSAGSMLPVRLWQSMRERWGISVGQLYGATELGTVAVRTGKAADDEASVQDIGPGVASVSMRVVCVDDATRSCAARQEGQLLVRSPSMAQGYVDGSLHLVDGHWLTGDLARMDEHGSVRITGRLKLLVDVGGYKVNPLEVEAAIASHPGVAMCLVWGERASDTVERLHAKYVASDPANPVRGDTLRSFLKERLSSVKVPRSLERVDSLARGPTGKLLRERHALG